MRSLRIVIIVLIITLIVVFIGSAARSYYKFLKEPVAPIINAIPQETSIIVKTKNIFDFFEAINNSALSDLLNAFEFFTVANNYIDTITSNHPKLFNLLESNEVIFALVPDKVGKLKLLITTSVQKTNPRTINNYIKNLTTDGIQSITEVDKDLYKITNGDVFSWYYIKKGVFAFSDDSLVLASSMKSLISDSSIFNNPSFTKLYKTGGKKVDASITVNIKMLASAIVPDLSGRLEDNTPFDQWSSFDLNIKKSEVLFGGFTFTTSGHVFAGQEPVQFNELTEYPRNTVLAVTLSLSNQELYTGHFFKGDTIHVKGFDSSLGREDEQIFNRSDHINSWIGNSVNMIFTEEYFRGNKSGMIMMIRHINAEIANKYLMPFLQPQGDSINIMHFNDFPSALWGTMFHMPGKLYCRITDEHVILSPDRRLLQNNSIKRKLSDSKELRFIKEWSGSSSNLFVFVRPDIIGKWILRSNEVTNGDLINFFTWNSSIGMQYNASSDLQYTHAWLIPKAHGNNKREVKKGNNDDAKSAILEESTAMKGALPDLSTELSKAKTIAEDQIDEKIEVDMRTGIFKVHIVNSKTKNRKQIVVIKTNGDVNMLDYNGKILWKYSPSAPVISELAEIDYYRNGKKQFLISTKKKLHIIDETGREIKESPVTLPEAANSEIAVFDYENKKDYRILYVGTDNKIYNLTLKGTELPDWQKPKVDGQGTINFYRTHGKDYLVFRSLNGSVRIFDRRGRDRIKLDNSIKLSSHASIYLNRTNSKGIFISVSDKGELIYIDANGKISKTSFGSFNKNPWFTYIDFDSDGSNDFVFAEKQNIIVYNKMKEKIAMNTSRGQFGTPYIYASSSKDIWIFARDAKSNEVTGFNNKGKNFKGLSIKSDIDPIIFNPGGSLMEILVTSKDNKIILTGLEGL